MKIKNEAKGIIVPKLDIRDYLDRCVNEESAWEELRADERKIQLENARIAHEWVEQGEKNLDILLNAGGIEKRLAYLFKVKKIEKASFAKQVGMGRTTIQRYTSNKDGGFKSTKKRLLKILDALSISVADFAFEPNDFEKWKASFDVPNFSGYDILSLRDNVLGAFENNNLVYRHNGETRRLPYQQYALMKSILESAFKVLDLVPHDEGFF